MRAGKAAPARAGVSDGREITMIEDARTNAESSLETKDETKGEELSPEQLDAVAGGGGNPSDGKHGH